MTHVHNARATMLARAFHDDPIISWVIPKAMRRVEVYGTCLDVLITATETRGQLVADADGAVLQLWHTVRDEATPDLLTDADGERMLAACGKDAGRARQLITAMDRLHPTEPHHYLAVIGTDPDQQGRGRGSAALRNALARCDASGLPSYLEATSAANRRLYQRLGFEDCPDPVLLAADGPWLYPMWRPVPRHT